MTEHYVMVMIRCACGWEPPDEEGDEEACRSALAHIARHRDDEEPEPAPTECAGAGQTAIAVGTVDESSPSSAVVRFLVGQCPACCQWQAVDQALVLPEHQRDDIVARIERGDFG